MLCGQHQPLHFSSVLRRGLEIGPGCGRKVGVRSFGWPGRRDAAHLSCHIGNELLLKQLADEWALITGASSGIGAEFARQLAARGMHLVLVARRREPMEALAEELRVRHATRCEIIAADLTDASAPGRVVSEVSQLGIRVSLLVNNAGFGVVGEVEDAQLDRLLELIRLNVSAVTEMTYRLLPEMMERRQGAIVNVSSLSAFQPVAYMGVYAASKAYVLHLSEALAIEVRNRGVTILAVCPGVTQTPFFDIAGAPGWLQKHHSSTPEEVVRASIKALMKRRMVIVPGWANYLLTVVVRFVSRWRVVQESTRYFRPRRKTPRSSSPGDQPPTALPPAEAPPPSANPPSNG